MISNKPLKVNSSERRSDMQEEAVIAHAVILKNLVVEIHEAIARHLETDWPIDNVAPSVVHLHGVIFFEWSRCTQSLINDLHCANVPRPPWNGEEFSHLMLGAGLLEGWQSEKHGLQSGWRVYRTEDALDPGIACFGIRAKRFGLVGLPDSAADLRRGAGPGRRSKKKTYVIIP